MVLTDLLNYIRNNPWLFALIAGIVIYLAMNRSAEGFQDPNTDQGSATDQGSQLSDPVHPKVVDSHLVKVGTNGTEVHIVTHHPDKLSDQIKQKYGDMPVDQLLDQMRNSVVGAIDQFFYQAKQNYNGVTVNSLVDATTDGMDAYSRRLAQGLPPQGSQGSQGSL